MEAGFRQTGGQGLNFEDDYFTCSADGGNLIVPFNSLYYRPDELER